MATKPYDPTLKALVETDPDSWSPFLGCPSGPTDVIGADIATVSGAADKVLRVAADPPYLLHLEFVAGHDAANLPCKAHVRIALLEDRHNLRVRSAVLLLHAKADSPQLTGLYEQGFPGEEQYLWFRYHVIRVWQLPPERLLAGGIGLLPLAPISAVTDAEVPDIIRKVEQRLGGRSNKRHAAQVWAAVHVLLGLRYASAMVAQLLRGVEAMKESSTYQAILEEGRGEGAVGEARKLLRQIGANYCGTPTARINRAIDEISDLARLEQLCTRVPKVSSWEVLLALPAANPRKGRRQPRHR